ncbi:MAG: thioredoxin domain-containing protein [archaeon]|nr:thioredoxin domain-containing protein [archaeon]
MRKTIYSLFFLILLFKPSLLHSDSEHHDHEHSDEVPDTPLEFKSDSILVISDTQYKEMKKNKETMIVFLYSTTSKSSHDLLPFFEEVANKIKEKKIPIKPCAFQANKYKEYMDAEGITTLPEFIIYIKNEMSFYTEERKADVLINKLRKDIMGPIVPIETIKELEEMTAMNKRVFLCTINPKSDEERLQRELKEFTIFATNLTFAHNTFVHCYSAECTKKYPFRVVLFRQFDEPVFVLEDNLPVSESELYIMDRFYSHPIGGNITADDLMTLFKNNRKNFFYIRNKKDPKHLALENTLYEFCKYWRESANSYFLELSKTIPEDIIANNLGIDEEDLPALVIAEPKNKNATGEYNLAKMVIYKYPSKGVEDFVFDKMESWFNDYLFGKFKPEPKTEATPKRHPEGYNLVVRKTWKKEVIENEENVLVRMVNGDMPEDKKIHELCWERIIQMIPFEERKKYNLKFLGMDSSMNEIDGLPFAKTDIYLFIKGKKENPLIFKMNKADNKSAEEYELIDWVSEQLGIPKFERNKKEEDKAKSDL